MLKSIINNLLGKEALQGEAQLFQREQLDLLFKYFSIGKSIHYYPEYHKNMVFQTVILAYRVNGQFIYSREALLRDDEGEPRGFFLPNNKELRWEQLTKIELLLPDTTELEKKLDYYTRAELGRSGQFASGNSIMLVGDRVGRGIPMLDTQVKSRQMMMDGPYTTNNTILVIPDIDTIELADRRKQRVSSKSPIFVSMQAVPGDPPFGCLLADCSDTAMRLSVIQDGHVMPELSPADHVTIEFTLGDGESELAYKLSGTVFRREASYSVINVDSIFREGKLGKISMLDMMGIKSILMNIHAP